MKPMVAIFSYGNVEHETFVNVLQSFAKISKYAWILVPHGGDGAIDRARSEIATKFLKSDCDILVMIDRDITWAHGDVIYLAEMADKLKALVGGVYSKRGYGIGWAGRFNDGKPHEIGSDRFVELGAHAYLGGGFMAMHRIVLERMVDAGLPLVRQGWYPFFMPKLVERPDGPPDYASEDWSICDSARITGSRVYALMAPVLKHWGKVGFTAIDGQGANCEVHCE